MYHIMTSTSTSKFDRDYITFLNGYISNCPLAKILRISEVLDDSCVTNYNIFKSVSDFACKNMLFDRIVMRSDGRYSSIEYYNREFTQDHRLYYYIMQNWTYDLNKYIMSKTDGKWIYIPENKYTLMR